MAVAERESGALFSIRQRTAPWPVFFPMFFREEKLFAAPAEGEAGHQSRGNSTSKQLN